MGPTYRPSKIKRIRSCGYRKRRRDHSGRKVLANRRRKGRARLAL